MDRFHNLIFICEKYNIIKPVQQYTVCFQKYFRLICIVELSFCKENEN